MSGLRQVAALRKVLSVSRCTSVRDLAVVPRSKAKASGLMQGKERTSAGRLIFITVPQPNPADCWALCKGQECVHLFRNEQGNQRHKPQSTRADSNSTGTRDLDCTPPVTTCSWETGPKWPLLKAL